MRRMRTTNSEAVENNRQLCSSFVQGFNVLGVRLSLSLTTALLDGRFEQLPRTLPLYRKRFGEYLGGYSRRSV